MNDTDELREEADADSARSVELTDEHPSYSEYLSRRADWKRTLAEGDDGHYKRADAC